MANSMTGYGRGQAEENGSSVTIEVKSVNHRFLDCNVKSTSHMFMLDDLIRKAIKEKFSRGYFEAVVTISSKADLASTVTVNEPMLKGYLAAAKVVSEKFGIEGSPRFSDILPMKDMFLIAGHDLSLDDWRSLLDKALDNALAQLAEAREIEGVATLNDVKSLFSNISQRLAEVEIWCESSKHERYGKLVERVKKLLGDVEIDEGRIAQEAAILVDKGDVAEEIARAKSHLEQVDTLLEQDQPLGRKLEFFLQEINREANTLGSKTSSSQSSATIVEIKSELEKIREQAQNLE